jgi:hypothetical protein
MRRKESGMIRWIGPLASALLLANCSRQSDDPNGPHKVAAIHDLMADVVMPQTDILWNSTAILTDESGTHDMSPKTDQDWQNLRNAAIILAETQNLLAMPGRKVVPDGETLEGGGTLSADQIQTRVSEQHDDFVQHTGEMQRLAVQAIKNIDAHDLKALDKTGAQIDQVCESCHLEFWYPPQGKAKKPS